MNQQRNAPLSEIVADTLRQSLKDGVYTCGERLAESVIAREMNVSQNTARDALGFLEKEGWLIKRPRRGMIVREFIIEEVRELYMLRATLERLALNWALDVITEDDKLRLANTISEARLHAGVGNRRGLRESIFGFHEVLLEIADRPQTTQMIQNLHNQCRLLENLRVENDPRDSDSLAQIITDYGNLLTRIRYDERKAAANTLYDMVMEEGRLLLPLLDLLT